VASLAALSNEVVGWLNRRDVDSLIPGWVAMVETDIAENLRARCRVPRATQPADATFITLPPSFCSMESIRDEKSGKPLSLEDEWTGPLGSATDSSCPVTAYRLVADCIEFLPHPFIPNPPDPAWQPQMINMNWYASPKPLIDPQDTNVVLEKHYSIYLFGVCKYGAMYELWDERAQQMEGAFNQAVMKANLWKSLSDYSGAPLRAVVRSF
jgi:hypothetical protein